ncbi:MAG TPA: cupin domain-containing protein [Methylocystis sp.]|nr:cupin domain-containing protein [Methylocystis sp.]
MSEPVPPPSFRHAASDFSWNGVERLKYKEEGAAPFKAISRQTLFSSPHLAGELRYFEIAPGGFSTLERHGHAHAVMVLRGRGACLVGDQVRQIAERDLISIGPWTWHQFRACEGEPLGFLCLVDSVRDKPQLPGVEDLAALRANAEIAAFLDENSV